MPSSVRASSRPRTAWASSSTTGVVRTAGGPRSSGRARSRSTCSRAAAASRTRRSGEAAALGAEPRAVLDAFAAGVNAYLRLGRPAAAGPRDRRRHARAVDGSRTAARCSSCATSCSRTGRRSCGAVGSSRRSAPRPRRASSRPIGARVPLIVPPPELVEPVPHDPHELDAVLDAMAPVAEVVHGSNSWALHGIADRVGRARCSPATRTASWRSPASTTSVTSRAPSSMPWASRSSACPASRTSGTSAESRGA